MGYGGWVRGNAGLFNVGAVGTLTGSSLPAVAAVGAQQQVKTKATYGGIQAGVDLGNFNLGNTGFNLVYGITGGRVNINSYAIGAPGTTNYDVPFAGAYAVLSKDGFVLEASFRHDFFTLQTTDASLGLTNATNVSASSNTGSLSVSYKYNLPLSFFIDPFAAISISQLSVDAFTVPTLVVGVTPVLNGSFKATPVVSDLGRLGARIGRDFAFGDVFIEPFVAASVWREFAGSNNSGYTGAVGPVPIIFSGSTSRVGTFGQYSVGVSAVLGKSGLLIFARGDLRSGSNVNGNNISGGLRYQF